MFRKNSLAKYIGGTLLLGVVSIANSAVLFDQSLNETDNFGFFSNIDNELRADNFFLTFDSSLQSISWFGMYDFADSSVADEFDIEIFDVSGSSLFSYSGSSVARLDSGLTDFFGASIYQYTYDLALDLNADEYLLEISNANDAYANWYWADSRDSNGDGETYYRADDSSPWTQENIGYDLAFSVMGEQRIAKVPEISAAGGALAISLLVALLALFRELVGMPQSRKESLI